MRRMSYQVDLIVNIVSNSDMCLDSKISRLKKIRYERFGDKQTKTLLSLVRYVLSLDFSNSIAMKFIEFFTVEYLQGVYHEGINYTIDPVEHYEHLFF